jgi:hypothetical protein
MGANQSAGAEAPPEVLMQSDKKDSLNFVVPTEFVELPSKGKYYPENHPLYMQESIEIRYMTAKDEDILTSKTLLKQGVALNRFISNIIVDRRINSDSLLIGDKNAVVVAARISGYGPGYATRIPCPACLSSVEFEFDLNEKVVTEGKVDENDGVFLTENNTVMIRTPTAGVEVEVKMMTGVDESEITKKTKNSKNNDFSVTKQLKKMIISVNGDTSQMTIRRFVDTMPARDSRHLRNTYKQASPNIDLTQHFECSECGHEQPLEVPFTADFFWPDR